MFSGFVRVIQLYMLKQIDKKKEPYERREIFGIFIHFVRGV